LPAGTLRAAAESAKGGTPGAPAAGLDWGPLFYFSVIERAKSTTPVSTASRKRASDKALALTGQYVVFWSP
jgi:hypothetical protein